MTNQAVLVGNIAPTAVGMATDTPPEVRDQPAIVTTAVTPEEWNRYVRGLSESTGYHLWEWKAVFERGLGHRTHYLAARAAHGLVGVLPLVEVRSRLFGRVLSSLPYVNYGGVLGASDEVRSALVKDASRIARSRGLSYVLLRHRQRVFAHLPVRTHKVTMLLPLKGEREAMWNSLDRKVRNQIRKAEKSQLTTASGGVELLDSFYAVFARNMRDLGTPVYGRRLFAMMLTQFPTDARVHVVRLGDQVIAGAISYSYGDVIEVPSASSLREHRALCPNHLMYWAIIGDAIDQGRRVFDFGRSTPGDGTYNFKEQWGASATPLSWEYDMLDGGDVPTVDRQGPRYQASIELWKKLPVRLATALGPSIARRIP